MGDPELRWARAEQIFLEAVELAPGERHSFAAQACGDDAELRQEVLAMLDADSNATGAIRDAVGAEAARTAGDTPQSGQRLGRYQLGELIGLGGMGAVYRARRIDDEFDQQVAIKLLRRELGGAEARQRFRHERQILASLEHPHIARLIDGGTTAEGSLYLVMELVEGVPMTEHCHQRGLGIRERLALFLQLCDAVSHAHQHLIIHRDLKPGNVLVTGHGVKLLDFGIAKLLDSDAVGSSRTQTGALLLTPDYASPEQIRGEPVSTATDIYALGCVLYELLSGVRAQRVTGSDPASMLRVICEQDPAPPSSFGRPELRGDLDTIVLKAMEKEPRQRYSSVDRLAEDIRWYLDGHPIKARPATLRYRAAKFVRRNRLAVGASVLVAVTAVAGLVAERRQANLAHERFGLVRGIANKMVVDLYDELAQVKGALKARQMLSAAATEYLDKLSSGQQDDGGFLLDLASAYQRLGRGFSGTESSTLDAQRALPLLRKAVALAHRIVRIDPSRAPEAADIFAQTGEQLRVCGDLPGSLEAAREATRLTQPFLQSGGSKVRETAARARLLLARVYLEKGDFDAAATNVASAQEVQSHLRGESEEGEYRYVLAMGDVAEVELLRGQIEKAYQGYRAYRDASQAFSKAHPENLFYRRMYATSLAELALLQFDEFQPNLGDWQGSIDTRRELRRVWQELIDSDPGNPSPALWLGVCNSEGALPLRMKSLAEAEESARKGLRAFEDAVARGATGQGSRLARARLRLAWVLADGTQRQEARRLADLAIAELRKEFPPEAKADDQMARFAVSLAMQFKARNAAGDRVAAGASVKEALEVERKLEAAGSQAIWFPYSRSFVLEHAAEFLEQAGDRIQAVECLKRNAAIWRAWRRVSYADRRLSLAERKLTRLQ